MAGPGCTQEPARRKPPAKGESVDTVAPSTRRRTASPTHLSPARLRRELLRRGITPVELAAAAGLVPQTVYNTINGRRVTSLTQARIVRALAGMPVLEAADALLLDAS